MQAPYAAVHAGRGLGGHCHRFVSAQYAPGQLQDAVRAMCSLNATLLRDIFASQGWGTPAAAAGQREQQQHSGSDWEATGGQGLFPEAPGEAGGPPGRVFVAVEAWMEEQQHRGRGRGQQGEGEGDEEEQEGEDARLPWPGGVTYRQPALGTQPSKATNAFKLRPKEMVQASVWGVCVQGCKVGVRGRVFDGRLQRHS